MKINPVTDTRREIRPEGAFYRPQFRAALFPKACRAFPISRRLPFPDPICDFVLRRANSQASRNRRGRELKFQLEFPPASSQLDYDRNLFVFSSGGSKESAIQNV
jgi:hypothetical protein